MVVLHCSLTSCKMRTCLIQVVVVWLWILVWCSEVKPKPLDCPWGISCSTGPIACSPKTNPQCSFGLVASRLVTFQSKVSLQVFSSVWFQFVVLFLVNGLIDSKWQINLGRAEHGPGAYLLAVWMDCRCADDSSMDTQWQQEISVMQP